MIRKDLIILYCVKDKSRIAITMKTEKLKILQIIAEKEEITVGNLLVASTLKLLEEKYPCTINKYDCENCKQEDTCNHVNIFKN